VRVDTGVSDEHVEDTGPHGTEQADDEARRRFQALTGMSADAARAWVSFHSGRRPLLPPRP
jgi:hypothetical protein